MERIKIVRLKDRLILFAAINGDGELEFYSQMGSQLLFMTFSVSAVNTGTDTETDTEESSGEEETDTEEEAI